MDDNLADGDVLEILGSVSPRQEVDSLIGGAEQTAAKAKGIYIVTRDQNIHTFEDSRADGQRHNLLECVPRKDQAT
jgi:hypothetical protein